MAFFQELRERQPFMRVPLSVLLLIAVLMAVYAVQAFAPMPTANTIITSFAFYPARYSSSFLHAHGYDPGSLLDRAIPFVSYMFLHGSWTHLLINCVWLLPFGSIVARRFGAPIFLLFFIVCGVAGALSFLASNWGQPMPVVGASAAISGLMAAAFRMLPNPNSPDVRPEPLAPIFSQQILVWSALWAVLNIVAGVTGLGAGPGPHLIAWQAHLGGYAAGLLLAGPFLGLQRRIAGGQAGPGA